jgi:hypothetical protein
MPAKRVPAPSKRFDDTSESMCALFGANLIALASGDAQGVEALQMRADARVLGATLLAGTAVTHVLGRFRHVYRDRPKPGGPASHRSGQPVGRSTTNGGSSV